MSLGNTFENDLWKLIFNGTPIAGIADNAASGALANLQMSFHTADPGEAGDQTSNECTYTGYARQAVARDSGGFTVSGNEVTPTADVSFPAATAGSETITHFMVGTASSGTGKQIIRGTVTPNIAVSAGITPTLTSATTLTID